MRPSTSASPLSDRQPSFPLDVIDKVQERSSSSPASSGDFNIRSSDLPLSQSSATSISEVLHDGHWTDPESKPMTAESEFAAALSKQLAKIARDRETVTSPRTSKLSAIKAQLQNSSVNLVPSSSVRFHSGKRTRSEGALTFRRSLGNSSSIDHSSSVLCKRPRPWASIDTHSPYLTADGPPEAKKRRFVRHATFVDPGRYAKQTASFRRALSLRSKVELPTKYTSVSSAPSQTPKTSTASVSDYERPSDCPPTVPCSPEPKPPQEQSNPLFQPDTYRDPLFDPSKSFNLTKKAEKAFIPEKQTRFVAPIIAPPPDHAWSPPLSEASQAKLRLIRFREREQTMRETDLSMLQRTADIGSATSLVAKVVDEKRTSATEEEVDQLDPVETRLIGSQSTVTTSRVRRRGIGFKMLQWILEVVPEGKTDCSSSEKSNSSAPTERSSSQASGSDHHTSFGSYASSSLSSSSAASCTDQGISDLVDQLINSPETRFHAAYLLMRFFSLVFGATEDKAGSKPKHGETELKLFSRKFVLEYEGSELVAWDVAVGCLALSVKLRRDFLAPLRPIRSCEYEDLAPHDMGYDDLEAAQRDILFALSYNLGGTPQAVLDDLWTALPSLRDLLDFDDGWSAVLQEIWLILFEAVGEPEIMEFPISLLTAAAVMEGLVSALVRRYQAQDPWYEKFSQRRMLMRKSSQLSGGDDCEEDEAESLREYSSSSSSSSTSSSQSNTDRLGFGGDEFALRKVKERVRRAKIESEGVMLDIQAALGLADGPLKACREWMAPFVGERL